MRRLVSPSCARPTNGCLLPFEILIGLAVGMPPALLGALLGGLPGRIGVRGPLVGGTIAALGLGVAAVHAPIVLARTVASESAALAEIRALIAAQDRFRSENPTRGFSCDLNELGERFDAPVQRLDARARRVGTYASVGDSVFSLVCGNALKPTTSYQLFAQPRQEGLGRWVYCAEADGRLRVTKRRRINSCLREGLPVPD